MYVHHDICIVYLRKTEIGVIWNKKSNFWEDLHYSAVTKYDSLSGPAGKMGPWARWGKEREGKVREGRERIKRKGGDGKGKEMKGREGEGKKGEEKEGRKEREREGKRGMNV